MLYPITVLTLLITYGIDKYLCKENSCDYVLIVLRVYRTPLKYDMTLAEVARKIMKIAVFLHFCFGYYMYSNSAIFSYENIAFSFIE